MCNVVMDGEFEKVKPEVEIIDINISARVNIWVELRDTNVH